MRRPRRAGTCRRGSGAATLSRVKLASWIRTSSAWLWGMLPLALVAIAMRVHNAFALPKHWGFDANWNWEYIERLTGSWQLPAPHEGWSMAHPPFFYYAGALLARIMDGASVESITIAIRLASAALGVGAVGGAVWLIRCLDPGARKRAFLAAALLLFLPVHVYMSAMLGEEIVASSLVSLAVVGVCIDLVRRPPMPRALWRSAGWGLLAGLALLTKLSGVLAIAAVGGALLLDGLRRRELERALALAAIFGLVAGVVGGWPYVRNLVSFGYLYPHDLPVHERIHTMPPGDRAISDYLRVPVSTLLDPRAIEPKLVYSVWGTTYTTLWYDGHRHFLPRDSREATRLGTAILTLALLPTLAFGVGLVRGLRRAWSTPEGPDTLFLLLVALTLAGYVLFTWRNPWYVTLKGSYMLTLIVPFAWYASEVLSDWTRGAGVRQGFVWTGLAALLTLTALVFSFGLVLEKTDKGPGFRWWENMPPPRSAGGAASVPGSVLARVAQPLEGASRAQRGELARRAPGQVESHHPLAAGDPGGLVPAERLRPVADPVEEPELLVEAEPALVLERGGSLRVPSVDVLPGA